MKEEYAEIAQEIIEGELARIVNEYAVTKDETKSRKLKEKIDVLKKIKIEVYNGNPNIIKMVLEKKKKGIIRLITKKQEKF